MLWNELDEEYLFFFFFFWKVWIRFGEIIFIHYLHYICIIRMYIREHALRETGKGFKKNDLQYRDERHVHVTESRDRLTGIYDIRSWLRERAGSPPMEGPGAL